MSLSILTYPQAINTIADHMLTSDQYWFRLVYYKPWKALTYITTLNYMLIDEPGLKLSKEAMKLVKGYSRNNPDFIFFPSLKDEERAAIVEEFIASLPQNEKEKYAEKWKQRGKQVLDNWRPSAIYSFMSDVEIGQQWESFFNKKLEPSINELAQANNIDLRSLSYYIIQ